MQTRRLGRTERTVGAIGLGTRWLGGAHPRELTAPHATALRAIAAAIDDGVDFVDVAPAWGDAEAIAGEAIRATRSRDRVVLSTYVPAAPNAALVAARRPGAPRLDDLLPAGWVEASIDRSLRATRLDAIPLALLGGPGPARGDLLAWDDRWRGATTWPELRGTMERLVRAGKVLHWGVVAGDDDDAIERVDAILGEPVIGVVQVALHLWDAAARPLVARAAERDVGVIARRPLAGGPLGGDTATPEQALRLARLAAAVGRTPPAARATEESQRVLARAEATRLSADKRQADDVPELALRYVLSVPGVTAALVGTRDDAHRRAALAAADGRALTDKLVGQLEKIAREPAS